MELIAQQLQRRRLLFLVLSMLLLAALLQLRYRDYTDTATLQIVSHGVLSPAGTDSTYYMQMGESAFQSGDHRIYSNLFFSQHEKFIYPPSSLFFTEALNLADHHPFPQQSILRTILLLSWAGSLLVAIALYRALRPSAPVLDCACIALAGILFLPLAEALARGQIQTLLTFLWGLAVLLWCRNRHAWSGVVIAITCAFKPQLALFLLWGVLRREGRFVAAMAGTLAVIAAASLAHFGVANNLDYFSVLSYLSRHGEALWANQSMNGLLNRLLHNGDPDGWSQHIYPPYRSAIYLVSSAFSAVLLLSGLILPMFTRARAAVSDLLLFGCISVVASPIAWEHHYGYFYFLIVSLLARSAQLTRTRWYLLTAAILCMANRLPLLDRHHIGVEGLVSNYLFCSGLVLLALLAGTMASHAKYTRIPPEQLFQPS